VAYVVLPRSESDECYHERDFSPVVIAEPMPSTRPLVFLLAAFAPEVRRMMVPCLTQHALGPDLTAAMI